MRKFEHATRCVLCGAASRHTGSVDHGPPSNGAAMLCADCGGWLILDNTLIDGTRPPTPAERALLAADERAQAMQIAWRAWRESYLTVKSRADHDGTRR